MTTDSRLLYSQLPATDRLLRDSAFQPLLDTYGHTRVVNTLRAMQEAARLAIRERQALPSWCDDWAAAAAGRLARGSQSALRPVFNLTGTVLHTNLGRALQAEEAVEAVARAMRSP
ncbi:L-seryl-tRNA(Sec) selenium transferase, partial [Cronobacter sakazakii]